MRRKPYVKRSEAVIIAQSLAQNHGGNLPSAQWLIQNGYEWLYRQMYRHPHEFRHIRQSKIGKTGRKKIRKVY